MLDKYKLIVAVGISGSGKSTGLAKLFGKDSIVSTDTCREIISGDENNQDVSGKAFQMFYEIIEDRLKKGKQVSADSTALRPKYRNKLIEIANKCNVEAVAILFDTSLSECKERQYSRDRKVPLHIIDKQQENYLMSKTVVFDEAFSHVYFYHELERGR